MKRLILAVAALASLVLLQPVIHAAGLSSGGTSAITTFLQGAVDRGEVPGIVALVVDRNGVIYHEAFGKQDVGKNIPMAKDSIFRIASMTKAITSMGVMMLVEEGKVKLDDDAAMYVPTMANRRVFTKVDTVHRHLRDEACEQTHHDSPAPHAHVRHRLQLVGPRPQSRAAEGEPGRGRAAAGVRAR